MRISKEIEKLEAYWSKIRSANEAGYFRARHEIDLLRRLDPELKDVTEDPKDRMSHLEFISGIDEQYVNAPYHIGIPKANFKGTWREYLAFRWGEFRATNQFF